MSGRSKKPDRFGRILFFACLFSTVAPPLHAEFELPFSQPVQKVVSLPASTALRDLPRFQKVDDLVIELRLGAGNGIDDDLAQLLKRSFNKNRKRMVLSGTLYDMNVERLREFSNWEVVYHTDASGTLSNDTVNALRAMGPVRKTIEVAPSTPDTTWSRLNGLRPLSISCLSGKEGPPPDILERLANSVRSLKIIVLPQESKPEVVFSVAGLKPLCLEILTTRNSVQPELLQVLMELREIEITLVVNGRLTRKDVRPWVQLPNLTLKVFIEDASEITPGLETLLNSISPPWRDADRTGREAGNP